MTSSSYHKGHVVFSIQTKIIFSHASIEDPSSLFWLNEFRCWVEVKLITICYVAGDIFKFSSTMLVVKALKFQLEIAMLWLASKELASRWHGTNFLSCEKKILRSVYFSDRSSKTIKHVLRSWKFPGQQVNPLTSKTAVKVFVWQFCGERISKSFVKSAIQML